MVETALPYFDDLLLDAETLSFIESNLNFGFSRRSIRSEDMVWSKGMYVLLGVNPGDVRPAYSTLQSAMHPEDHVTFEEANALQSRGAPFSLKLRFIRRNGSLRHIQVRGEILVDDRGDPHSTIATWADVTDRYLLEESLRLSTQRLSTFVDTTGDLGYVVQVDGHISEFFGSRQTSDPEVKLRLGKSWRDLVHPDDLEKSLRDWTNATKTGAIFIREHRVRSETKGYRWRRVLARPIFSENGQIREYVGVSRDVEREKTVSTMPAVGREITGAQVRAGRAIANWSVRDLSEASSLSIASIRRVEEHDGDIKDKNEANSIREALIGVGIEFIFPEIGKPGVRPA